MPISAPEPVLEISGLASGYGKIGVLRGIDLRVGWAKPWRCWVPTAPARPRCCAPSPACCRAPAPSAGKDMAGASPRDTVQAGLVHVVEGHRVFTQLSVFDNLLLAGYGMTRDERATQVEEALAFFPDIAAKRQDRAGTLSGGQRRMLAVAQGLVRRPRLLMLDEPSAGLSPVLVDRVLAAVARLREGGTAVLLVEQLIEKALAVADRVYALARGSMRWKPGPTRPICRTAWSTPTSARTSTRR